MSFYDDASWLLIPEGIEEDIVFAQKPTNGLGDLTFTRASDATRTNSAGVIERTPWNLLQMSEMFADAYWTKNATGINTAIGTNGIQANVATAPNGTLTADRVNFIPNASVLGLSPAIITAAGGSTHIFSIYVKGEGTDIGKIVKVNMRRQNGGYIEVNANTTLTGEWQRLVTPPLTLGIANTNLDIRVYTATVDGTSAASTALIWGAQLVEGTDAKPYFATTNRQDVPRLDYRNADGSLNSCPRLLLEPQRTNSIRNSTMVGAVVGSPGTLPTNWSSSSVGLTQSIVGTGVEAGLTYIDVRFSGTNTGVNAQILFESQTQITASNAQTWAGSFWFKIISAPTPPLSYQVRFREGTAAGAFVADGLLTFVPTTNLQRFTYVRTNTGALTERIQPAVLFNLTTGATYDFTIRIAAPQMELGAYATTFIPTTTAAVTRILDGFTRNNIFTNGLITAAGGTWFVDLSNNLSYSTSVFSAIGIGNTTALTTNSIILFQLSSGGERVRIAKYIAGTPTTLHTTTTSNAKIAIKWNGTTADVFVNGVKVVSGTAFTPTNMENLNAPNVGMPFQFNQLALFPTPLTDAQCIQLTT